MAAVEHVNPTQFGLKQYDPAIEKKLGESNIFQSAMGTGRPARISIKPDSIRPSQDYIYPEKVEHYAQKGWTQESKSAQVHMVRMGGEHVVWNGHHRVAAALQKGQKRMRVWLDDLDAK